MLANSIKLSDLRSMTEVDMPFLYSLYASTREKEMAMTGWAEEQKLFFLNSQFQLQHNYYQSQFENAEFKIIEINNQPVGRLYYGWEDENLRIIDISLLPNFQRHGIGRNLMRELMELAKNREGNVLLYVDITNPVRSWYLRLGFVPMKNQNTAHSLYEQLQWSSRAPVNANNAELA